MQDKSLQSQEQNLLEALIAAGADGLHTNDLSALAGRPNSRIEMLDKDHIIVRYWDGSTRFKRYWYIRRKTWHDRRRERVAEKERRLKLLAQAEPMKDPRELSGCVGELVEYKRQLIFLTRRKAVRLTFLQGELSF